MRITSTTIKNYNEHAVEIIDWNNTIRKGWFIKIDNQYKLFPFDDIWNVYVYKPSQIKSIKHLTNGVVLK